MSHNNFGHSLTPSPIPSKKFQEEAFTYVSQWCKASREFVKRKVERWKLLEDLYHNRRELNSWGSRSGSAMPANSPGSINYPDSSRDRWQSDIVLAPSYIVDTWTDKAYQSIFSGPEWLTVIPETSHGGSGTQDLQFPTSFKLQELLLARLSEGQIHVRLYEILQHLVLYGSVYAKIFWYSKDVTRHRWDYETLQVIEEHEKIYDCPVLQVIPLDRVLLDWTADHSDVQRHTGIGHRVDKTYQHVLEQFDRDIYHLNRAKFLERRQEGSSTTNLYQDGLLHEEAATGLDADATRKFTVWEWHGRIPTENQHKECLCTIITDREADSPEDGIMVRLTQTPVLWSGLRPFLTAHYTPLPGPLGMGAIESNLDLIHSISQFISQSQDNTRLTANAQLIVRRGSSAARQIGTDNDVVYPGKVWMVDDPGDIQPFPPLNFPQQEVNHLIDFLNGLLERRTTVSDMALGVSSRDKTATEAHILHESAMSPFATRTDLFARSFLEPLGKLALSMLQQFLLDDQTITVKDSSGQEVPLVVTSEEIQKGRYRVVATLTRQDSTRLAKAQSIERVLPTLSRFQGILASEGVRISFSELIKRYLDLIGVEGADRILSRVDPGEENVGNRANISHKTSGLSDHEMGHLHMNEKPTGVPGDFPSPLVEDGGPMGPNPTDGNALAQLLQVQAAQAAGT
jgi:hypothetical protein